MDKKQALRIINQMCLVLIGVNIITMILNCIIKCYGFLWLGGLTIAVLSFAIITNLIRIKRGSE